ncbi:MAG: S49 family peptidase [Chloroflexi bacterium]|nr:S49 family peptidase [Chloroflexota bacterium]
MTDSKFEFTWEKTRKYLLWLALPLIIGILMAALIPQPSIGLIYLSSSIDAYSAKDLLTQISYAREHPEISAVVLVLDSPGGTVVDTEAIYLEFLKLRKNKPVVTSINSMAASGAYYLTVGTDYAFAKPTSTVGNIGIIGYLPSTPMIFEGIISTGPYKLWGSPRDTYMRQIEMSKQGFYNAVKTGRGDRLKVGPEVVLSGQIWPGSEAQKYGLIDELGTQSDAIEKAASMAHVHNYRTDNLANLTLYQPVQAGGFFATSADGSTLPYPKEPGVYMLYIPPMTAEQK